MRADVILGDCLDVMRTMPAASVDAVICDPPYSLSFMGRAWDTHSDMNDDPAFGYWLSGFIDGEGCFRVQKHERGTHSCAFSLKLRRDERGTLEKIRRYIGAGTIGEEDGSGGSSPQARLVVQDKQGCQRLVDILDKYPLVAKKRLDFEAWAEAVCEWTTMPRGNRWHGPSDQSRMATLKARIESTRLYTDIPWSGNGFQDWCRLWSAEALRVAKPGAALLAFGGTRTFHRLACAIEDSGWRIYDCLSWMYGQGFPKHRTHLKPAWEPIVFAAKKGARFVNVDGCRLGTETITTHNQPGVDKFKTKFSGSLVPKTGDTQHSGRWPANVVLDERAAGLLDESAPSVGGNFATKRPSAVGFTSGDKSEATVASPSYGDSGGASRFFYTSKATRADREDGLAGMPRQMRKSGGHGNDETDDLTLKMGSNTPALNHHPTVKPTDLMRWLCRLVTPPGGTVLDPFCGSGSTGVAALSEGFNFVGIEREAEYVEIARRRIANVAPLFAEGGAA